jgi:hypothetical protein
MKTGFSGVIISSLAAVSSLLVLLSVAPLANAHTTQLGVFAHQDKKSPNTTFGKGSKPWLGELLARLKPNSGISPEQPMIGDVAVVKNNRAEQYLLVEWVYAGESMAAPFVEFYKIKKMKDQPGTTFFLRAIHSVQFGHIYIQKSTGHPWYKGGSPVATIMVHEGGTLPSGFRNHFVLLEGNTREITPEWVEGLSGPEDEDGDGNAEFAAKISNDEELVDGCKRCWTSVPSVLVSSEAGLVPACKSYRSKFSSHEAWNLRFINRIDLGFQPAGSGHQPAQSFRLELIANLALLYAQIGQHKWADLYGLEYARGHNNPSHPILEVLKKAKSLDHLQCPVSAALSDDPRWRVK